MSHPHEHNGPMPQRAYRFGFYREAEQCRTLVVNANNGPENNGRRTQWLERLWSILDVESHARGNPAKPRGALRVAERITSNFTRG